MLEGLVTVATQNTLAQGIYRQSKPKQRELL